MIRVMVHNPIYRGEFAAIKTDDNGNRLPEEEWVLVDIPPCVSEFIFLQAQNTSKKRTGGRRKDKYLLSGKLWDVMLDKPRAFSGATRTKGGFSYRRKQFKDKEGIHHSVFEFPGKQMDDYVWGKIMEALKDPQIFIERYLSKEFSDPKAIERLENESSHLRGQRANMDLTISRIEKAYEMGHYSEEQLGQKISQENREMGNIETRIQEIENEIALIGSIDVEVKKLKEASEQIKYRLENLNQKQKKLLVQLFVDRIEIRRSPLELTAEKKVKRWDVKAEIYFRFNPNKFPTRLIEGCAEKPLKKEADKASYPKKRQGGAGGQD
jgi:hypothetical protein